MIPTLTISGLQFADLLGGTVVLGFFVVIINLLVDIAYRMLNPRVELS
jgi:ABC-type dipeptide/oligopeptide/nickel transport system permease component